MAAQIPLNTSYDNASLWANLTSWTAQQLRDAVSVSRYAESLLQKLGYFIPVDHFGQRVIPEATSLENILEDTTTTSSTMAGSSEALAETIRSAASSAASSVASQVLSPDTAGHDLPYYVGPDNGKGLGSFFSYMTSKWALSCILMAVVLNRTYIFAATRRRLTLRWHTRLVLRIVPVLLLLMFARRVLRSIQCQTSPEFSALRWGNSSMKSELMFANPNVFFNHLTSTLLLGASDRASCEAVRMIPSEGNPDTLFGSLSILWPLYGVFALSQFLETVSCSVQGRATASETSMTLFEISLAFAEADSALGNQLGWGVLSSPNSSSDQASGQAIAITRSMILKRVNTPVEVLIVALLCIMSHVTSHILGIFQIQSKFRLAQTSFWAMMFLSCIMTSFYNFSLEDPASQGLLRFPTVSLIGHIPHIIVLIGIVVCLVIYAVALGMAAANPPPRDGHDATIPLARGDGFWGRLREAHSNMQAGISLGESRIAASTDFYTALLRAGMAVISMASEAVYLQEDRGISLKQNTWLEDERFREIDGIRATLMDLPSWPDAVCETSGAIGLVPIEREQLGLINGYARERAKQSIVKTRSSDRKPRTGVGAAERSTRWVLAVDFFWSALRLGLRIQAKLMLGFMACCGLRRRPRWLVRLADSPKTSAEKEEEAKRNAAAGGAGAEGNGAKRPEWEVVSNGKMYVPRRGDVDVEDWVRKNLRLRNRAGLSVPSEQEVDSQLYKWWLDGGFWGSEDRSGDYMPQQAELDDDATSVISSATADFNGSDDGWESEGDDGLTDGQRTPTQESYNRSLLGRAGSARSREGTPLMDSPMPMSDLARLLNPSSPEEREEARALSAHFASDKILTRSRYQKVLLNQRSRVLLPRGPGYTSGRNKRWTPEEEAVVLEQILLSRRAAAAAKRSEKHEGAAHGSGWGMPGWNGGSSEDDVLVGEALLAANRSGSGASKAMPPPAAGDWATGAAGMGENGPQCVVCHSEPRTIIVWPCRCLSLCDECRVNLAMNNYGNCVCCRREVVSFSRIYVP